MLEACCNMKENENTEGGGGRAGAGGAKSNHPAVTSDPVQGLNSRGVKELLYHSKKRVN